jgi:hypothetical protein
MKAFWWYKENAVAGMARPGFNRVHWFDLPFDEAVFFGWIGLFSSGSVPVSTFRQHLARYAPLIFHFHKLDETSGPKALQIFETDAGILQVARRIRERTGLLDKFLIDHGVMHFEMSRSRLEEEIQFLKAKNIDTIVALTERHHAAEILWSHFQLHHLSMPDMGAPTRAQAEELAQILKLARKKNETVAVHCLAGIGRTSTMIMAAHILNGDHPAEVRATLDRQNPKRSLTRAQLEFLASLCN